MSDLVLIWVGIYCCARANDDTVSQSRRWAGVGVTLVIIGFIDALNTAVRFIQ